MDTSTSTRGTSVKRDSFILKSNKSEPSASSRNDVLQSLMALSAQYGPSRPSGAPDGRRPSRTAEVPAGPAHPYNEEQVEGFRALFNIHDTDGSGGIDEKELASLVSKTGIKASTSEVEAIHKKFDANSDGVIDFDEFLVMMSRVHEMDLKKQSRKYSMAYSEDKMSEIKALFDKFDSDSSGSLDREQLQKALSDAGITLSENELTDFTKSVDTDGDGLIDFKEFLQIMNVNEADENGKTMTIQEIVNKNLMKHHEQTQKRRRSVSTGAAAGRRASFTGDTMEDIGKAAERATLVAGGLEADAAAAREIALTQAQLKLNTELYKAATKCDVDAVKGLLEKKADAMWENPQEENKTALHAACLSTIKDKQQVLDVCTALLEDEESEVDINKKDEQGNTPLYLACGTGPVVVDMLLAKGAEPGDQCGEKMSTALIRAAAFGQTEMAKSLIATKTDLDTRDLNGQSALIRCVQTNRVEICKLLLEAGCDHTIEDIQGLAAMNYAQRMTLDKQQMMQVMEEFKCKPGSGEPESEKKDETSAPEEAATSS